MFQSFCYGYKNQAADQSAIGDNVDGRQFDKLRKQSCSTQQEGGYVKVQNNARVLIHGLHYGKPSALQAG